MLLAIDVGNSRTAWGLFRDEHLIAVQRSATDPTIDPDGLLEAVTKFLATAGAKPDAVTVWGLASVVPSLAAVYRAAAGGRLCEVDAGTAGLRVSYADPATLGPDRVANAVAVAARHSVPAVVVDLGTALTLEVVDAEGSFAGGVILPGPTTALNVLAAGTARLPRVAFGRPARVVGRSTEEAMRAGVFHGTAGAVDRLVEAVLAEMGFPADTPVVATGGWAGELAPALRTVTVYDETLTLEGIRLVCSRA